MDQDFIVDDDEENTQETGELSGLAITGEEESQSQSRDSYRPRRGPPSQRVSPPAQPPPQWYLDGMKEISDADGDDDEVVGYLSGRFRKKPAAAGVNDNGEVTVVSRKLSLGIPEPNPSPRIQMNRMIDRGGGNAILNPHRGSVTSKNQHLDRHQ